MNNKLKLIMLISITAVASSVISGVITSMIVESDNSNNIREPLEIIDAAFEEEDPSILLDQIKERLSEINAEFGTVHMESTKLSIVTPQEEKYLLDAKKLIEDWDIPYFGMGIDYKVGSLVISFKTQQIADAYTPIIDQLIYVPYYVEISDIIFEYDLCATQDIDCDVFLHG